MAERDGNDSGASSEASKVSLGSVIARARSEGQRRSASWVALGSGVFAFGVGLCVWSGIDFSFRNPFEIVSRITLAHYPKQQDVVGYAIAIISVAAGVAAGWYSWCALACARLRLVAKLEPRDLGANLDATLATAAWPFAALAVAIWPIAAMQWSSLSLVAFPLFGATVALGVSHFATSRKSGPSREVPIAPATPETSQASWPSLPSAFGFRAIFLTLVVPLLLYAWLYDGYLVHHRIDMHHEGEILGPWNALLDGAIPFRDIYIQHGLFQNVGKGWLAEKLFGVSLASLRATEHLLGPLGHLAFYFLGLALFRSWLSAVALVLVASIANVWAVDRQVFGILAVAALAYSLRSSPPGGTPAPASWGAGLWNTRMAALAGAATALAFFYSAEIGVFSAAACGGFLVIRLLCDRQLRGRSRWLPLASYTGGAVVCFVPFAITLASAGALDDLLQNTWRQIAYQSTVWGRPYPPLEDTLKSVVDLDTAIAALTGKWFQWYLPPLIYLFALGHVILLAVRGRLWARPEGGAQLLILLAALSYFASSLSRADSFHLKFGTLLMWVFVGLAIESVVAGGWRSLRRAPTRAGRMRAAVWPALVCAAASSYLIAVHAPIEKIAERAEAIGSGRLLPRPVRSSWPRLGAIRIGSSEFSHLREVVAYIDQHTRAGEPIFDFSSQPTYYFLADRPNPTRYALAAYAATQAMQREVIEDLERSATPLVIYRSGGYLDRLDRVPFAERNALIDAYLREHYVRASHIGGTVILLRKTDQAASSREFQKSGEIRSDGPELENSNPT